MEFFSDLFQYGYLSNAFIACILRQRREEAQA